MTPIIALLAVVAYFAVYLGVSRLASRDADNSRFFTGARRAPWPVVAIATVGAAISGVTFISVPGMVTDKGYSYLQMALGFIAGYWVIAFLLVPLFYRRNLISIYGYLGQRYGMMTYRTGAWFFIVSKMLGASVRFFVVCIVLHQLISEPLGMPFVLTAVVAVAVVWACTYRGGVQSVIWTDLLKSLCMILAVGLCIWFIAGNMGLDATGVVNAVSSHPTSRMFYFDCPTRGVYFWKQFVAGVFMAIAINGLDQDMMQRNLACRDSSRSRKNMVVSGVMQFFVIGLFLALGTVLALYIESQPALELPAKSDETFALVACHSSIPVAVGVLFVVGLVAASYSAAGSALVSLTTSFIVDILGVTDMNSSSLPATRRRVHLTMAAVMVCVIVGFYLISQDDAISAVYTLASYTYGPILGLFVFGMFTRLRPIDWLVPVLCVIAPLLSLALSHWLRRAYDYEMGFELLLLNAVITMTLLGVASSPRLTATTATTTV